MDPAVTSLLAEGAKLGFVVTLLLVTCFFLARWVRHSVAQQHQEAINREAANRAESLAREAANRAECLAREQALAARLTAVEDGWRGEAMKVQNACASALEYNARAMHHLCEKDTGLHLALINNNRKDT